MIPRTKQSELLLRLQQFPAVGLLGPRQAGKTTLAHLIAADRSHVYLDLESPVDRHKLSDVSLYFASSSANWVILDEVHRVPDIFQTLRGIIDRDRRENNKRRFLLLGSASLDLIKQAGESLAGRIAYVELGPFTASEIDAQEHQALWFRGGFPDSYLASDDLESTVWREQFIRTYLERDVAQFGPRIPAETLRRLWTMLAHLQGSTINNASLARNLGVDGKTVARYLDLLVDLLLVRRLPPRFANVRKRLVKSPKFFVRDSGIVHTLLGIDNLQVLYGHPVVGGSWEGFVIENLLESAPARTQASFYRTAAGAEVDLVLDLPRGELWVIEIKRSLQPRLDKGFHFARDDLKPDRSFLVYGGASQYPIAKGIEVISLSRLVALLSSA